jgi:hypothetical protein
MHTRSASKEIFEGEIEMEASTMKHSQPVFFVVAMGWLISVAGLAYMWHMLS